MLTLVLWPLIGLPLFAAMRRTHHPLWLCFAYAIAWPVALPAFLLVAAVSPMRRWL